MDFDSFDKWSDQLHVMLDQLQLHEQALKSASLQQPLADTQYLSDCYTQANAEKFLIKIGNDIRALSFCYNNLRAAIHMPQEQFDALE